MIRVTFDRDYVDNLEDYYRRNECIREQQYLSQEKLLHLAAFCISKVVDAVHENGDSQRNDQQAEAAFDAVRQLALLCGTADQAAAQFEPVTIVNGQTNDERQDEEQKTTTSGSPTLVERSMVGSPSWWAAAGSVMYAVARAPWYPNENTTYLIPIRLCLKVSDMLLGKINKLVHLSQQTYQPNSKLIPSHNDKGYGTLDDETWSRNLLRARCRARHPRLRRFAAGPDGRVYAGRQSALESELCERNEGSSSEW